MSASNSEKLPRYRPDRGYIEPASALTWIAFGTALPERAWDQELYPGASLWPRLRPDELGIYLERLSRGDTNRLPKTLQFALTDKIRFAAWNAARAADPRASYRDFVLREASTDELRAAAVEWKAGFEAAKFRPDLVADALDGASSALRRAAMRGEIAVFVESPHLDERQAWLDGANHSLVPPIIRVPAARFEHPVFFFPDGFSPADYYMRFNRAPSEDFPLFRAALDGSEVWERWPDPDPGRVWTTTGEQSAPPQPASAEAEEEELSAESVDPALAARIWMRAFVKGGNPGLIKPKRDPTLRECMADIRCTYRQALAAWEDLPPEWKNPPRKPNGG